MQQSVLQRNITIRICALEKTIKDMGYKQKIDEELHTSFWKIGSKHLEPIITEFYLRGRLLPRPLPEGLPVLLGPFFKYGRFHFNLLF